MEQMDIHRGMAKPAGRIVMRCLALLAFALPLSVQAGGGQSSSPDGARAYIISPKDGAVVSSPLTVKFGLAGMGVAPAGVEKASTGHHHLLVDAEQLPALDKPMGPEVKHFGGGQTETTIELSPGEHTLQLILGDHYHVPHNPPVISKKITITVKD